MNQTIVNAVNRAANLTGSYGTTGIYPELVDATIIASARCELVNQELNLFTRFCYQKQDVRFINLRSNCQIPKGVWTPWGSSGKSLLTRTERDTTRRYLLSLARQRPKPLFFYHARHWHVDTIKYTTLELALEWVHLFRLTPTIWLDFII